MTMKLCHEIEISTESTPAVRRSRLMTTAMAAVACITLATVAPAQAECVWRGTSPMCNGRCNADEIEVRRSGRAQYGTPTQPGFANSCFTGTKALCCPRPAEADAAEAPPPPPTSGGNVLARKPVGKGKPGQLYVSKRATGPLTRD